MLARIGLFHSFVVPRDSLAFPLALPWTLPPPAPLPLLCCSRALISLEAPSAVDRRRRSRPQLQTTSNTSASKHQPPCPWQLGHRWLRCWLVRCYVLAALVRGGIVAARSHQASRRRGAGAAMGTAAQAKPTSKQHAASHILLLLFRWRCSAHTPPHAPRRAARAPRAAGRSAARRSLQTLQTQTAPAA